MSPAQVVVGLSGGVDSAVSALLLKQRGYPVSAVFMKNWEEDDDEEYCAASEDLADARRVAEQLDIPLRTVNFSSEYWEHVFSEFLDEYRAGRTPNPDVFCNQEIKFKAFLEFALDSGAERIATGHYADIHREGDSRQLLKGLDPEKDQSYFLYRLNRQPLSRAVFPLGSLHKGEVRQLAAKHGLAVSGKRDSTGICFIGKRPFREFLSRYIPPNPGDITTTEGQVIGAHQGLMYHTLGQRKGLGIGGLADTPEAPWYVVRKDMENNRLVVAQGHDHPLLFSRRLRAVRLNWIDAPPAAGLRCSARVRYRQADQACRVLSLDETELVIDFEQPQRAVTPGQSVVLYQERACLGGGIIDQTWRQP